MLKGVNDSLADARELVRLLKDIPSKINLIPFNPWPGAPFERSTNASIQAFGDYVNNAGFASPVRTPRGEDIMAACGQLKSDSVKQRASGPVGRRSGGPRRRGADGGGKGSRADALASVLGPHLQHSLWPNTPTLHSPPLDQFRLDRPPCSISSTRSGSI